jgi:hypothetical protein
MKKTKSNSENKIQAYPVYMSENKFDFIKEKTRDLIILVLIIIGTGCSSNDHLKFRGLPITGDLGSFKEELGKMGYQEVRSDDEGQMKFTGKFLEKDCMVYLSATKESHIPYMVRVDLPREPHDSVKYSYERLKNHCASILGPGASRYKQFSNSSRFLFNEPGLVKDPQNGDFTRYLSRKGSVYLEVKLDYLSIIYLDKKNSEISAAEGGKKINMNSTPDLNEF